MTHISNTVNAAGSTSMSSLGHLLIATIPSLALAALIWFASFRNTPFKPPLAILTAACTLLGIFTALAVSGSYGGIALVGIAPLVLVGALAFALELGMADEVREYRDALANKDVRPPVDAWRTKTLIDEDSAEPEVHVFVEKQGFQRKVGEGVNPMTDNEGYGKLMAEAENQRDTLNSLDVKPSSQSLLSPAEVEEMNEVGRNHRRIITVE